MAYKEYFSEAKIELMKEIRSGHHPQLTLDIVASDGSTAAVIGEIAAYVNVILDGAYSEQDFEDLFPLLIEKLRDKRAIRIVQ